MHVGADQHDKHKELPPQQLKAFDYAQDLTKLLITLATGIVTLAITFFHDFATNAPIEAKWIMAVSWIAYIASIPFGLFTLSALTGVLEDPTSPASLLDKNILGPWKWQWILFLIGLLVTFAAGVDAILAATPVPPQPTR